METWVALVEVHLGNSSPSAVYLREPTTQIHLRFRWQLGPSVALPLGPPANTESSIWFMTALNLGYQHFFNPRETRCVAREPVLPGPVRNTVCRHLIGLRPRG
jgi:hypothetical protein